MATYVMTPAEIGATRTITRENLLSKLCFVRFGGGLEAYGERLKGDLERHQRTVSSPEISRPTIFNWIRKGSAPTRKTGVEFLHRYMVESIEYKSLSTDQKKVYAQIERYMIDVLKNDSDRSASVFGKFELPIYQGDVSQDQSIDGELGTYVVYRTTFSDAATKKYSVEIFNIYRAGRDLRFRCWFRVDKSEIGKFEGSALTLGNYIWFIGTSHGKIGRMRGVMTRRDGGNPGPAQRYKWGVMLSDIPYAGTREPAACRVLMQRIGNISDLTGIVAKTVKLADQTDLIQQIGWAKTDLITRLIDNQVSAFSIPGGVTPAVDESGEPVRDQVLTVDSRTLQSAAAIFSSHESSGD